MTSAVPVCEIEFLTSLLLLFVIRNTIADLHVGIISNFSVLICDGDNKVTNYDPPADLRSNFISQFLNTHCVNLYLSCKKVPSTSGA